MSRLPEEVRSRLRAVAPGVHLVPAPPNGAGAAGLLVEDEDVLLVDAGGDPGVLEALAPHVDVCLLTHVHPGHVRDAHRFREVWAPRAEARALESVDAFLDVHGVRERDRDAVTKALEEGGYRPVEVARRYRPGGVIVLKRQEWHLVAAPGHSPGHTALWNPQHRILFSGDVDDGMRGPWYGFPSSDVEEFAGTAERLADLNADVLLTSHTPPRQRSVRPALRGILTQLEERDQRILTALKEPRTLDDLVRRGVVTRQPPVTPFQACQHRVMIQKHLHRLMEQGRVAARQDGRYART